MNPNTATSNFAACGDSASCLAIAEALPRPTVPAVCERPRCGGSWASLPLDGDTTRLAGRTRVYWHQAVRNGLAILASRTMAESA
jgi:hypothetical protein